MFGFNKLTGKLEEVENELVTELNNSKKVKETEETEETEEEVDEENKETVTNEYIVKFIEFKGEYADSYKVMILEDIRTSERLHYEERIIDAYEDMLTLMVGDIVRITFEVEYDEDNEIILDLYDNVLEVERVLETRQEI